MSPTNPFRTPRLLMLPILAIALMLAFTACDDNPADSNGDDNPSQTGSIIAVAGDETLTLFNADTKTWQQPQGLGLGANWMTRIGDSLYVVNSLSNTLQRFDISNRSAEPAGELDIGLSENRSPYASLAFRDSLLLISNLQWNSITVVNVNKWKVVDDWEVNIAPVELLTGFDQVYVVHSKYDFNDFTFNTGSVWKLGPNGALLDSLTVGVNPQFAHYTYPGEIHVVCTGNYDDIPGTVYVLTLFPIQTERIINIGYSPGRSTVDKDDHVVYLAAGGWSNEGDENGLILRYDYDSLDPMQPINASLGVVDVAYDSTSGLLYAACRDGMRLDVFDDGQKVGSYELSDPPNAIEVLYAE